MTGLAQLTEEEVQDYINSSGPELRRQFPKLYGFLGGLAGTAPDQFEGSVLDPKSKDVRKGAEYGFPLGVATAVAPFAGGIATAKGLATGGKAAQQGMLRWGGREDLIASHGTSMNALRDHNGYLIPELSHLSLAVQRNALRNDFAAGNQGITLIAKPGKFDPATSPSILHRLDAWTPDAGESLFRQAQSNGATRGLARAQARMLDRYATRWPKGGENATPDVDTIVLGNQRFNSFKSFENSKAANQLDINATEWENAPNAKALFDYLNEVAVHRTDMGEDSAVTEVLQEVLRGLPKNLATAKAQGRVYKLAGIDVQKALQEARSTPVHYAELKNFGQTPLNGDTWAGALYRQPDVSATPVAIDVQNKLLAQLRSRGIQTIPETRQPILDFQAAIQLQRNAR